jgi:hypothetical protein
MQSKRHFEPSLIAYVGSLTLLAAFLVNWKHPTIVTSSHRANLWIADVALLVPWIASAIAIHGFPRFWRWVGVVPLAPLMLASLLPLLLNTFEAITSPFHGNGPEFGELSRIHVPDGSDLVVYYVDCGATCSHDLMLRHERSLIGPLLLVHNVVAPEPSDGMSLHLVDAHHVEVDGTQYRLMRHVAF